MAWTGQSPLGAVGRGLVAGAIGTAAMTAAQTAWYRATGSESSSTPAEVGRRLVEGVLRRRVPEERLPLLNQVMHWAYGTGWGVAYGLVAGTRRPGALRGGAAFGAAVWGSSLVELPAMRLAPPVWEYPPRQLASDVGFHLVYGIAAGAAFAALSRR